MPKIDSFLGKAVLHGVRYLKQLAFGMLGVFALAERRV